MCSRCIIQFCDNYYSSIFHSDNLEVIDNSNGTHLLRRVFLPYEELFAIEMNNTIDVSLVRDLHICIIYHYIFIIIMYIRLYNYMYIYNIYSYIYIYIYIYIYMYNIIYSCLNVIVC